MQQKSNNFSTAKERLLHYLETKGLTQYAFSKDTGLSNGFLKSGSSISSDNLRLLSTIYVDLNLLWIITGEGEMILEKNCQVDCQANCQVDEITKKNAPVNVQVTDKSEPTIIYRRDPRDVEIIELLRSKVKLLEEVAALKGGNDYMEYGAADIGASDLAAASMPIMPRRNGEKVTH